MEYVVHFYNDTAFRTGLADSIEEAKEVAWMVVLNAQMYGQLMGYKDEEDFFKRVEVTVEQDRE